MGINTFEDLFLRLSLYDTYTLELTNNIVMKISDSDRNFTFDCYCVYCKKETTFRLYSNEFARSIHFNDAEKELEALNNYELPRGFHFNCQRNPLHKYSYYFRICGNQLTKIGQSPSVADIEIPQIQKYEKLLKKDYRDFSKAIGLHSHGVGAGSFVYLRRIFENLIEDMHKEAKQNEHWDENLFQRSRMDDKIKLLQDKLPDVLVENRYIYGIMSKGIHELSEDECKALFPDVKLGIELILDEKLYQLEKQSKIKAFSNFVASTTADLKS